MKLAVVGGNNVLIPWKSLETGQIDRVMATLGAGADTAILFITQSGNIVMAAGGDKSNLQTPASSSNSIFKQLLIAGTQNDDQLKAWYTAPGDTTKKPERVLAAVANVVAYDKQTAPVYIVEVNGAVAPDASYIQTYLNSVYAPAIANFTVSKKAFTTSITSPFDNTLTDKMGYNKEQDVFIKAFKNSETIDKEALYLFFLKENTTHSDIKGHMPFNRQFGFIYAANQSITELTRTMAHELGHGAFRLKHTFSNENKFVQIEKQTPNLMDYASGSELLKYQWDECHDFDLGCNWFEDGDEAASKDYVINCPTETVAKYLYTVASSGSYVMVFNKGASGKPNGKSSAADDDYVSGTDIEPETKDGKRVYDATAMDWLYSSYSPSQSSKYVQRINELSKSHIVTSSEISNDFLLSQLKFALITGTWLGDESYLGNRMFEQFKKNVGGDFYNTKEISEIAITKDNTLALFAEIKKDFITVVAQNQGSISSDVFKNTKQLDGLKLPSYSTSPSLLTLVGGTQEISIYLSRFTKKGSNNYNAELTIFLFDDFGGQESDWSDLNLKKILFAWMSDEYYVKSQLALWILQKQRGYKPIHTVLTFKITFDGTY